MMNPGALQLFYPNTPSGQRAALGLPNAVNRSTFRRHGYGDRFRKYIIDRFIRPRPNAYTMYGSQYARGNQQKWREVDSTESFATTWSFVGDLPAIVQGTTANTRIGNRISIRSIYYQFNINLPTTTNQGGGSFSYRLIWLVDHQTNGAQASINDVFAVPGTAPSICSTMNLTNSNRFKVLKDIRGSLNYNAAAYNGMNNQNVTQKRFLKGFIKCNIPIEYSNTSGGVADIRANNIYLVFCAETVSASPTFDRNVRYRYDDLNR